MKKLLVLGGAGYIGSHTVHALIESGFDVVVADNLEKGHRAAVHPKAAFREGDIRDATFMDALFSEFGVDCVIHFAAYSLVGESVSDPLKYYDNNVGGTRAALSAMAKHGVRNIVFSSSAAVYGEPEEVPIPEGARLHPQSPYGASKLTMEQMMAWCARAYGMRYVSLRYFNACGALLLSWRAYVHFGANTLASALQNAPKTLIVPALFATLVALFGDQVGEGLFARAAWAVATFGIFMTSAVLLDARLREHLLGLARRNGN